MKKLEILTKEQKELFVAHDYCIGRIHALNYVVNTIDMKKHRKLQRIINKLCKYSEFGSGDKIETKFWEKIWDYLNLQKTYDELWENYDYLHKIFNKYIKEKENEKVLHRNLA